MPHDSRPRSGAPRSAIRESLVLMVGLPAPETTNRAVRTADRRTADCGVRIADRGSPINNEGPVRKLVIAALTLGVILMMAGFRVVDLTWSRTKSLEAAESRAANLSLTISAYLG